MYISHTYVYVYMYIYVYIYTHIYVHLSTSLSLSNFCQNHRYLSLSLSLLLSLSHIPPTSWVYVSLSCPSCLSDTYSCMQNIVSFVGLFLQKRPIIGQQPTSWVSICLSSSFCQSLSRTANIMGISPILCLSRSLSHTYSRL